MQKTASRLLSFLLCLSILCGSLGFGTSALTADDNWQRYYTAYMQDGAAVSLAPGADDSTRSVSWYAPADCGEPRVIVSENADLSGARTFSGTTLRTPEGDNRCKVTVSSLWPGKTYYYQCVTDAGESDISSFRTMSGSDFTAMYVTDIHVSRLDAEDSLVNQSYTFSEVVREANSRTPLDLIVSAGDQASQGLRSEYTALAASPLLGSIPFALCPGNHDRKGIAYKFFTNNPNEYTRALTHALISYDYCYTKGDALFLVFDSNVGSMTAHRNFVRDALRRYPDAKWRVAVFHHDLYGGRIERRESENALLRTIWAPMMDEFRFDLVLLGHSHYFTITNAMFRNRTNEKLDLTDGSVVTDPKGAIVMVSGSINHPRTQEDGEVPPLGENVAYDHLTDGAIYNLLDFRTDSVRVRSFELGADAPFHTFTIAKSSPEGGHPANGRRFFDGFIRLVSDIYGVINEVWTSARFRLHWNDFVEK